MVKFAKQLEMEAVPEWRGAYCNYKQLKKAANQIKKQLLLMRSKSGRESTGLVRRLSFESPIPRLTLSLTRRRSYQLQHGDFIRVNHHKLLDGSEVFETQLQDSASPTEQERVFFAKLDEQLNKVNDFYRVKEAEYINRAQMLDRQMQALVEMQAVLEQNRSRGPASPSKRDSRESNSDSAEEEGSLQDISAGKVACIPPSVISIAESESLPLPDSETSKPAEGALESASINGKRSSSLNDLLQKASSPSNQMKMSIPRTTPRATISALSQIFWEDFRQRGSDSRGSDSSKSKDDMTVSRKKVQYAEKMLRTAFIEFYRGLTLLKGFSSLNIVAFGKILKKFDKITGRRSSAKYLKAVEGSYVQSSDRVAKLMEKVELIFTAHFTKDDRRHAMRSLRPFPQKSSHTVSFFLGLFSGCSIALFAALGIVVHIGGNYVDVEDTPLRPSYMESIFEVFSMLALIILHLYMYGCNVYMWRRARINYAFIFEFSPGKELRYREVLLVASGLTALVVGGMLAHLAAHFAVKDNPDPRSVYVDIIPLGVVAVAVMLLFLPFNLFYYSSRVFFLRSLVHLIMAPLYKVVFADFFLGDQLTSQVQMLRNMEYFSCYYMGGFFVHRDSNACLENKHFKDLAYVVSLLPYFLRLMQCFRRWVDEGDRAHIANGGKYLSAMVAVAMRLTYTKDNAPGWLAMFIMTSTIATFYQLYWDLVVDWGLLQPSSKNPWLRDELMLRTKAIYFCSMVLNTLLRLAWVLSLTHVQFGYLDRRVIDLVVASLEVIRRGQWNFFRLENEHLNNVGKYRAVKTVPLPFREVVGSEGAEV